MKVLFHDHKLTVALQAPWVYVDDRKWGFVTSGAIYCHRKQAEKFRREYGFHIPYVLISHTCIFELPGKNPKEPTVWLYSPKEKQRMLYTDPLIFVSLSRLTLMPKAPHVTRPRPTSTPDGGKH